MKLFDNQSMQEIDFYIPEDRKEIAVNCSGGADSGILLYMTAHFLKTNNRTDAKLHVLTCANDKKHRWNARKAADIINYTISNLNWNQFGIHYTYYRDKQKVEYFHEIEYDLIDNNKIDTIISGITANPKVDAAVVEDINGDMIDIKLTELAKRTLSEPAPVWNKGIWYNPFKNVDKRFVAAMYNQFGVDDLIDLTRSCEGHPADPNVFDPKFENEPCGECWWCLERKWAFGDF